MKGEGKPDFYRKKCGVCMFCGHEVYYGIGVDKYGQYTYTICRCCAKKIMMIRLSPWCIPSGDSNPPKFCR